MTSSWTAEFCGKQLSLAEISQEDDEKVFHLELDGARLGELRFLIYSQPDWVVGDLLVAIWAGTRLYVLHSDCRTLTLYDRDDEIHELFISGPSLCLRGESSIGLFHVAGNIEVARFDHNDVILESWWEGTRLWIRDLGGQVLAFDPWDWRKGQLRPVAPDQK